MTEQDLSGCVTSEELAGLFDEAFAMWRTREPDPKGRRQSPRMPTDRSKPIFVVSSEHEGHEISLNCRATLVDVSADGLGIALSEPLPVGTALHFAFLNGAGERSHGMASVVSMTKHADGYRIGLIFPDTAQSLDIGLTDDRAPVAPVWESGWRSTLARLRHAVGIALCTMVRRETAHRELSRHENGRQALFVVDVKLFRYTARIDVDGKQVVSRSGVFRDRAKNVFFETGCATTIRLNGGGFLASATLRPNAVTACSLEGCPQPAHPVCPTIPHEPGHSDSSLPVAAESRMRSPQPTPR